MSAAGIEINDTGLLVAADGKVQAAGPGYALLAGETVVVGERARKAARLEPLNVENKFWSEMDLRPLSQRSGAGRSRADLAYVQLSEIWGGLRGRVDGVGFAVPASLGAGQLALV